MKNREYLARVLHGSAMRFCRCTTCLATLFLAFLGCITPARSQPSVRINTYDISLPDSATAARGAASKFAETLVRFPSWKTVQPVFAIERPHSFPDRTADFYLLLALAMVLGGIRMAHPRYFGALWRSFYHPIHTPGSVREQLDGNAVPNLVMNILFAVTGGAYLYAIVRVYRPEGSASTLSPSLLLPALIAGVAVVYSIKWAVIRASGWAFGVSSITEHYLFNVSLINKLLAIALLPFIVLLAFADPDWVSPLVVVSLLVVGGLFVVRYVRSWSVFGAFFQYSRFHFLTYFCASEILPLAVLTKLAARALL